MGKFNTIYVNNIVFDNNILTMKEDYFLLQLYRWSNKEGIAKPELATIQKYLKVSKRTICRYEKKLIDNNFIDKIRPFEYQLLHLADTKKGNFTMLEKSLIEDPSNSIYNIMLYCHLCRLADNQGIIAISLEKLKKRVKCRINNLTDSLDYWNNLGLVKKTKIKSNKNKFYYNKYIVYNLAKEDNYIDDI